jgi:hypothetical protein
VPYNLFRLFLVHKILASKYICENGEKKREKKKKKEFPASRAGGDFGTPGASARAGVLAAQLCGATAGGRRRGAGPHAREREGLTALTATKGGGFDRGLAGGESRGGSPPWVRFFGGEAVAKHGRVKGVTRVG